MASDSDVEEFYDAPEELSPFRETQKTVQEASQTQAAQQDVSSNSPVKAEPPLANDEDEGKASHHKRNDSLGSPTHKIIPKIEQPLKNAPGEIPVPVAPPRRKKQQKKEALAKSQVSSAPSRPPPPRPTRPAVPKIPVATKEPKDCAVQAPDDRPQPASCKTREHSKPVSLTASQPCIHLNCDATDMDEVLMKGSASDVVKNQDLDEYKSPAGSKMRVDKEEEGMSTPLRAPSRELNTSMQDVLHKEAVRSTSSSGRPLSDMEILEQVIVKNLDTGETVPLSLAEDKLPKCVNPMALQIMRLTSEYSSDSNLTVASEDGHMSDSSLAPSIKLESKRKKLKKFWGKTVQKIKSVADEVKARREESSSSDEDENIEGSYVKMKTHRAIRDRRAFEKIHLLQDLSGEHIGAIWVLKFSLCGRLLAAAGQDNIVRVWVLKEGKSFFDEMRAKYAKAERGSPTSSITSINSITSAEDDITLEEDQLNREDDCDDPGPFKKTPFCTYHGHTSDVLDLSWSKNYFILSSSMDKTVRLWHISRHECLCCFQHVDFVTAICFHPRDDRYFLSGSLDGKIRLWNIPEKKVALWNEIDGSGTSLITAANFCQNGKLAVVGTYDGRCIFYDTERLKYHTQVTVRSTRGKNARGRKISGIEPMPGEDKVLITSNDSRVRLYDLKDHSLFCKFRGVSNSSSQIKASFSPDGQYVVCGSEDHFVYIWRTSHDVQNARKDRNEYYESFSAHDAVVTAAVFAPIPSLIAPVTDGETKDKEDIEKDKDTTESEAGATGQNFKVLATADWSGCIKLFVNR